MAQPDVLQLSVVPEDAGMRLDAYIFCKVPECSRSLAAQLIRQGHILVDGARAKPSHRIKASEQIAVEVPPPEPIALAPEPMALDVLYEDRHLIVINKPSGLVVHPAAGHPSGTLVNGILHHCPDLAGIGGEMRPGIVHRLDKDTSGVIIVAKSAPVLANLSAQFKARQVAKQYLALVHGVPDQASGAVDLPVGRHPVDRKKMSTISPRGREALTLWRIKEKFQGAALLEIDLKTGRTHQIRVHCQSMGHPLLGERVYGSRKMLARPAKGDAALHNVLNGIRRQMLHAFQLRLVHPVSGEDLRFEAPLPEDMKAVIMALRAGWESD
ncbi:MAG: RluA family pseudouridine synthase [Desulfobacteraceae bacterium]